MKKHQEASAWFDGLYAKNKETQENIPWARFSVNPLLQTYLEKKTRHQGKALVIGCGLGDDAEALAELGYDVVAIDVSESALSQAKERFPNTKVFYEKQDIFEMPTEYDAHFDFVFESLTIQSLPVEFRTQMIQAVSDTVAKGGELLVVAHERTKMFDGPPWPLQREEIDLFLKECKEISFERVMEPSGISDKRFCVLYEK